MAIGYEFLRERLNLGAFPLTRPARVRLVTRGLSCRKGCCDERA
jgi:hypothetical protein